MRQYQPNKGIEGLVPAGGITELGAEVVGGGDLQTTVRVDWGSIEGPHCSGLWGCEAGTFKAPYPFTEMFSLLEGEVTITDGDGNSVHMKPGDTFFAAKGELVTFEIHKAMVKTFLAIL